MVRPEPPTRTLAPTPRPTATSPLAPTYSPASAPNGMPIVGASTAQPNTPPALIPMLSPIILSAPACAWGGRFGALGVNRHSIDWWPAIIKPMLGLTTHLSIPACVHDGGGWAPTGAASSAPSASAATVQQIFNIE